MSNELEKLTSISQDLKDFLIDINWEERTFMTAISIFETTINNAGVTDASKNIAFIGELADSAIKSAKIFIDRYKNNLQNS
ncbi:hypothetical protein [Lachnospira sp.]|jgi:hypothetical protein|uniref:hypothetical protein n=1 Tax=Lachnospira sp. TaxID=2049031 RepID=UPI00257A85AE|nr:hypothetical protein [Lachnospira sp.]